MSHTSKVVYVTCDTLEILSMSHVTYLKILVYVTRDTLENLVMSHVTHLKILFLSRNTLQSHAVCDVVCVGTFMKRQL